MLMNPMVESAKNPLLTNKSYLIKKLKKLVFFIAHLTHPPDTGPAHLPEISLAESFRKMGLTGSGLVENARVETWIIGSWICNYTTVFIGDFY